eukprot:scaffold96148_cov32-Tisochrysis_lutea.AAC.1
MRLCGTSGGLPLVCLPAVSAETTGAAMGGRTALCLAALARAATNSGENLSWMSGVRRTARRAQMLSGRCSPFASVTRRRRKSVRGRIGVDGGGEAAASRSSSLSLSLFLSLFYSRGYSTLDYSTSYGLLSTQFHMYKPTKLSLQE